MAVKRRRGLSMGAVASTEPMGKLTSLSMRGRGFFTEGRWAGPLGLREPPIGRGKEEGLWERVTWLGAVGVAWKLEGGCLDGMGGIDDDEEEEEWGE